MQAALFDQQHLFDAPPMPPQSRRARDAAEARSRKLNGQFAAERKTGSLWIELSLEKLKLFLREKRALASGQVGHSVEFTFDEFRARCEEECWPLPASVNAWGCLPKAAVAERLCEFAGRAEEAKRPASHGRLVKVWRAL